MSSFSFVQPTQLVQVYQDCSSSLHISPRYLAGAVCFNRLSSQGRTRLESASLALIGAVSIVHFACVGGKCGRCCRKVNEFSSTFDVFPRSVKVARKSIFSEQNGSCSACHALLGISSSCLSSISVHHDPSKRYTPYESCIVTAQQGL